MAIVPRRSTNPLSLPLFSLLSLLGGVLGAGCHEQGMAEEIDVDLGVSELPSAPVPRNFDQINDQVLTGCAGFSVCHSTKGNKGKLDLCSGLVMSGEDIICAATTTPDSAYKAIMTHITDNKKASIENIALIVRCRPDDSFFVQKLELPASAVKEADYGERMPASNGALEHGQIQGIRDWISRGAHRHEAADVSGTTCTMEDGG